MAEENKEKTIYFKLGEKRAIFGTPDKKITLNRFEGKLNGKISNKDEINYSKVITAISNGDLIDTGKALKDSISKKEEVIELTNMADKFRLEALTFLRKLHKEELLEKIQEIRNPYLVAAMIEQESRGKNASKRRREGVIKALKARLGAVSKNLKAQAVMFQYLEDTTEEYKAKRDEGEPDFKDDQEDTEAKNNF